MEIGVFIIILIAILAGIITFFLRNRLLKSSSTSTKKESVKQTSASNKHSSSIYYMAVIILAISIIAAFVSGEMFRTVEIQNNKAEEVFNYGLALGIGLSGAVTSLLFFALGHIAAAIEDLKKD